MSFESNFPIIRGLEPPVIPNLWVLVLLERLVGQWRRAKGLVALNVRYSAGTG